VAPRLCCAATGCRSRSPGERRTWDWSSPRMSAPPEVLILEDHPEELHELESVVRRANLEPLLAAGPAQALARLEHQRPILAVIDLDMSRASARERRATAYDVLRRLHQ